MLGQDEERLPCLDIPDPDCPVVGRGGDAWARRVERGSIDAARVSAEFLVQRPRWNMPDATCVRPRVCGQPKSVGGEGEDVPECGGSERIRARRLYPEALLERLCIPETHGTIALARRHNSAVWGPGTVHEFTAVEPECCRSTNVLTDIPDSNVMALVNGREVSPIGGECKPRDACEVDCPFPTYPSVRVPEDDRAIP